MASRGAGHLLSFVWTLVVGAGLTLPVRFAAQQRPVTFDCTTLAPAGRRASEAQSLASPCPLAVSIGQNYADGVRYAPGQPVRVQFRVTGSSLVTAFFCRFSQVLMTTPLGVWTAKNGSNSGGVLAPFACLGADDALVASGVSPGTVYEAYWTPPTKIGLGNIEIDCSVVGYGGIFWIWNSFLISESRNSNNVQ